MAEQNLDPTSLGSVSPSGRAELLAAIDDAIDQIEAAARGGLGSDAERVADDLARTGGIEKYDRRRSWWSHHHQGFAAALSPTGQ